jgi:hypothetical protein
MPASVVRCVPALLALTLVAACDRAQGPAKDPAAPATRAPATGSAALSDRDIADAYHIVLARLLVLRQQRLDLERRGMQWNTLVHRAHGADAWTVPDPAMLHSEAWVALDEHACVRLEVPDSDGRAWNWQMVDGWGETLIDVDEGAFADGGTYAFCLRAARGDVPEGAARVELPVRKSRALLRVAAAGDVEGARRVQQGFRLAPLGGIRVDRASQVMLFDNDALPRAEAFDHATLLLDSEPDRNAALAAHAGKVRATAELVASGAEGRARANKAITTLAWPELRDLDHLGVTENGWWRPTDSRHDTPAQRAFANLFGIRPREAQVVGWVHRIDGDKHYTVTFPKTALPESDAPPAWSIVVDNPVGGPTRKDRNMLASGSRLAAAPDGSIVIGFGPTRPTGVPEGNWLRTEAVGRSNLAYRIYRPAPGAAERLAPPALVTQP